MIPALVHMPLPRTAHEHLTLHHDKQSEDRTASVYEQVSGHAVGNMNNAALPAYGPPPPPTTSQHSIYNIPPPDEPPPSYDDATHSSTAPLLVGPPPNYGTYRAYPEPDESSEASSDIERTDRSLPEWVGQALVVLVFVSIIYGFWKLVNDPDGLDGFPG